MSMLAAAQVAQGTTACDQSPTFPDVTSQKGYFASDIALNGDGDLAVVGHIFSNEFEEDGGSAQIFELSSGTWTEVETIAPNSADHEQDDSFGASVDLSGDFVIVSAPFADNGDGAAYIFERDSGTSPGSQWSQHDKLTNPGSGGNFGGSLTTHETVAIDGRIAAVSAPDADVGSTTGAGKVYIYALNQSGTGWDHEDTLSAPTPQASGQFGFSIEISRGRIIVGAPTHSVGGEAAAGEAFVFERGSGGVWSLAETLQASIPVSSDFFGNSVSIDSNAALVGAPIFGSTTDPGFATLFGYNVNTDTWEENAELTPDNDQDGQRFGVNVSISGSLALVGASSYDIPNGGDINVGAAYLYQRQAGGGWDEVLQLEHSNGVGLDRVGETLALGGDEVFVGVLGDEPPDDGDGPAGDGIPDNYVQVGSVLIFPDVPSCP